MNNGTKYKWIGFMGVVSLIGIICVTVTAMFHWPAEPSIIHISLGLFSNVLTFVIGAFVGASSPDVKHAATTAPPPGSIEVTERTTVTPSGSALA